MQRQTTWNHLPASIKTIFEWKQPFSSSNAEDDLTRHDEHNVQSLAGCYYAASNGRHSTQSIVLATNPGGKSYRSEDRQFVGEIPEPASWSDRTTDMLASRQAHPPYRALCTKLAQIHRPLVHRKKTAQTTVKTSFILACVVSHTTGFYFVIIVTTHLFALPTVISLNAANTTCLHWQQVAREALYSTASAPSRSLRSISTLPAHISELTISPVSSTISHDVLTLIALTFNLAGLLIMFNLSSVHVL